MCYIALELWEGWWMIIGCFITLPHNSKVENCSFPSWSNTFHYRCQQVTNRNSISLHYLQSQLQGSFYKPWLYCLWFVKLLSHVLMHLSCFYVNQFVAPVVYFIPSMHPAPNTLEKKNLPQVHGYCNFLNQDYIFHQYCCDWRFVVSFSCMKCMEMLYSLERWLPGGPFVTNSQ